MCLPAPFEACSSKSLKIRKSAEFSSFRLGQFCTSTKLLVAAGFRDTTLPTFEAMSSDEATLIRKRKAGGISERFGGEKKSPELGLRGEFDP